MTKKILLFIHSDSVYFSTGINDFKKIIQTLSQKPHFEIEIIDVKKNPELAEKYQIDALPTLMIGEKKFIGKPDTDKVIEIFRKEL